MGLSRSKSTYRKKRWIFTGLVVIWVLACTCLNGQSQAITDHISTPKHFARTLYRYQGGNRTQWICLDKLWTMESHWNFKARNPNGGALGIPQALPANKMLVIGKDYKHNWQTQVRWGLLYIKTHWKNNACNALQSEHRKGWY